jgi:ribosomal protein L22
MADETKDKKAKKEAEKKASKAPAKKAAKADKAAPKKAAKKAPKAESKNAEPKKAAKKSDSKSKAKSKTESEAKAPAKKAASKPAPKKVAPAELVVRASARYVRIAPRKARLIADQVRGMHIEKARALLQFSPRGAAQDIHKLIDSAAANAENNHDLIGDEMRISSITVDEGPTLKRYRPRAQGRATPIHKRTSHIAVALTPVED